MTLALRVVSHSEIGLVRKNNQDSGYASEHLLVVADGMGGAAAGDLASAVAVDTLMQVDGDPGAAGGPDDGSTMLAAMAEAVEDANDRIADLIADDVALDGMGTTVTAALFDGTQLGLVHIGDSRAYLLRGGSLRRLTHDHSWVQSLVDEGRISIEEAAVHPHRSLLLRVLNGQPGADAELALVEVGAGDRLMFCSDGLCGLVDDPEIGDLLALPDRADALDALVEAARAEGGVDNITVIVADVVADVVDGSALAGPSSDHDDTPVARTGAVVLGAAAERSIPPAKVRTSPTQGGRTAASEGEEDTVVTRRLLPSDATVPATGVDDPPAPSTPAPPPVGLADESRYDPRPPARRRYVRPLVTAVIVLVVIGAGLSAAYAWTRSQFYVGMAGSQVAIYRGVSESLPGVPLSELYEVQPLAVADLPAYYQERVRSSIDVPSLAAARDTVAELRDAVRRCNPGPGTPTGSTSASPTPTSSTSAASASPGPASTSSGPPDGPTC